MKQLKKSKQLKRNPKFFIDARNRTKKIDRSGSLHKFTGTRKSGLPFPRTRRQEVLCLMIEYGKPLTYLEMTLELNNNNTHRCREYWETKWHVQFVKKEYLHKNRFSRLIKICTFKVKNKRQAVYAYRRSFTEKR